MINDKWFRLIRQKYTINADELYTANNRTKLITVYLGS